MQQLFAGPTIICPELAWLKIGCYNSAQKTWTTFFKKEFASKTKNQFIIDSRYFSRRMQIMEAFKDNFDPFRKKPVDLLVLP